MGLLDILGSDDMRQAMGLLAAAGPTREPMSFGQRMQGWMQGEEAYKQRKLDRASQEQERLLKQALMNSQIQETQAQAQQRALQVAAAQRAAEEQARFRGAYGGSAGPISPQQALAAGGRGPTPEAAAMIGQQPAPQQRDWVGLMRQFPERIDEIKKLMEQEQAAQNFGQNKVARTIEVAGPNGMPGIMQADEYGRPVGKWMPKAVEMSVEDLGGKKVALNKYALQQGQSFDKTNTPDAILSANTTMRGQNMTDARAREKNQIDKEAVGKVDWKQDVNGSWVGLPKEVNGQGPVTPVTTTVAGKREMQARNALDIINEAKTLIDKGTGSYVGAGVDLLGKAVGVGTPGAVAGGQLKALEGALMMAQPRMEGPQSDKDVQLYRQMAAQIGDPTVPPSIKKAALGTIEGLHKQYAGGQQAPMQGGPRPGVVQDGYRFKGGNPADPNSWEKL